MEWAAITALFIDVDGVLTDGRLCYAPLTDGPAEVIKAFHVQDGLAIKLWRQAGGRIAVVSGRESAAVARRAHELGVEMVVQGVDDKLAAYERVCREWSVRDANAAYMGDDLPDIDPMRCCTLPIAPANAVPAVKRVARLVTRRRGGEGAVQEAIEWLLRKQRAGSGQAPGTSRRHSEIPPQRAGSNRNSEIRAGVI